MLPEVFTQTKLKSQRENPKLKMPPVLLFLIVPTGSAAWYSPVCFSMMTISPT